MRLKLRLLSRPAVAGHSRAVTTGKVRQGKTIGDPTQLGAALVIGPGGEVWSEDRARDASDNAAPEAMPAAIRESSAPARTPDDRARTPDDRARTPDDRARTPDDRA
jgi:hypothetical protein